MEDEVGWKTCEAGYGRRKHIAGLKRLDRGWTMDDGG